MNALGSGLLALAAGAGAVMASARFWCLVLCLAGLVGLIGGAFVLAGIGWAMVTGGACCLLAGIFILVGIARAVP